LDLQKPPMLRHRGLFAWSSVISFPVITLYDKPIRLR
jgi:hypothetical protein